MTEKEKKKISAAVKIIVIICALLLIILVNAYVIIECSYPDTPRGTLAPAPCFYAELPHHIQFGWDPAHDVKYVYDNITEKYYGDIPAPYLHSNLTDLFENDPKYPYSEPVYFTPDLKIENNTLSGKIFYVNLAEHDAYGIPYLINATVQKVNMSNAGICCVVHSDGTGPHNRLGFFDSPDEDMRKYDFLDSPKLIYSEIVTIPYMKAWEYTVLPFSIEIEPPEENSTYEIIMTISSPKNIRAFFKKSANPEEPEFMTLHQGGIVIMDAEAETAYPYESYQSSTKKIDSHLIFTGEQAYQKKGFFENLLDLF